MAEEEAAIRRLVESWMTASRAGDTARLLDLMADDVLFMIPGREPFGKEEFRAASESLKSSRIEGDAEILEIHVEGKWAWIRNRIDLVLTPPDQQAVRRSGHALTILRKDDGLWRLFRDANLVA